MAPPAAGIDPDRTLSQYVRDRWESEAGFPRGPVYAISQTADGYLWIGTERGLVRFDGLNFQLVQPANSQQSVTHVLGLAPDADGSLWVRLRRPTLLRYVKGAFRDAFGDFGNPKASASAMARGADGSLLLWVLQGEPKAMRVREGRLKGIASPERFSRSPVLAVAETADGDIWVGTRDSGLFRIRQGKVTAIREGLPDSKVNALAAMPNNQLWVGTDAGVVRWDGSKLTKAGISHVLDGVQALALCVDSDSNLWVGTDSMGLVRVNAHGVALHEQEAHNAVTAIFEDRERNLWVGDGRGLERLRDSPFVTYSGPEGLASDGSNPVYVDSQHRLWFSHAGGGLYWFRDGWKNQITIDGLDRDVVYSISGRDGEIWVGRQRGGLTRLRLAGDSVAARTYTRSDGLGGDSVYAVHLARDGSVWAGTLSGGVSRLHRERFQTYTTADGLPANTIQAIAEGADGTMWIATPSGLAGFSGGRIQTVMSADVNCLLEDASGVLWAGTSAGIRWRTGKGKFQTPRAPAALREPIYGLAADSFGAIWVASANHVMRASREKLLRGDVEESDVREFGLADGLRSVQGVKRHRSLVTDAQGRLWLSLDRGISVVDPARLQNSSAPAIVHVQSLLADGKVVGQSDGIRVPGGKQRITLRYGGLSLSIPDRVRFRYRLDGFDRDWSEPVALREAAYTNLPPSTYRFRVVAANPDAVWNPAEASLSFTVDPLYWQTWWFRAGSVMVCILAGFMLYRLRLQQATRRLNVRFEERLAERTRIAQELHDTLLQGFISASMQVHVAADRLPAQSGEKAMLARALALMSQVIEEGRNTVRGLRATPSYSRDLEQALSRIQSEFADVPGCERVQFQVVVEGERRPVHPLLRDEVYRIAREALTNAFRHARAERIGVQIQYSPRRLRVAVRDDGVGIDPEVLQSGRDGHWGVSGMRERAERIGASLRLWSRPESGTEVELSVPGHIAFADHGRQRFRLFRAKADDEGEGRDERAKSNTNSERG